MMRSSTGGSQARYQVPSGYTTAIGPPSQMRRQLALVRRMPPCSESPSSLRRRFKKFQAVSPRSFSQHFGSVWSQQRKMWRLATGTPIDAATPCWLDTECIGIPVQSQLATARCRSSSSAAGDLGVPEDRRLPSNGSPRVHLSPSIVREGWYDEARACLNPRIN